jgi:tRNA(fMet)-specific endonuclease VapC
MTLFILDSDHVSLILAGNITVCRMTQRELGQVATSIVTVQEVFNGWVSRINDREHSVNPVSAYSNFWNAMEYFKAVPIVNYDDATHKIYLQLLSDNPALRKNRLQRDLRIAAIGLSRNATIVTRNRRDFALVPDLTIADWSEDG